MIALIAGVLLISTAGTSAQTGNNLLQDPGFEDTNMKVVAQSTEEGVTFSVNAAWEGWYTETPRNAEWQNQIPFGTGRNNAGFGFVRSGNRSMEISRGFSTFTAALYQTVTVPAGANVQGSAWAVVNISGDNSENANSTVRVGIDPTGGSNPLSSNVVWSNTVVNPFASNGFRQMSVNATANGTRVTLFLWSTQTVPTEGNGVYWDDASLRTGGPGGPSGSNPTPAGTVDPNATAVPTVQPAPPTAVAAVPFVNPQPEQNDGSIIHTVQEGDTLSSIAVAYGVPTDEIRQLNPEIGQGRFLTIGQQLVIERPDALQGGGVGPGAPIEAPQQEQPAQPAQPTQPAQQGQLPPPQQGGGETGGAVQPPAEQLPPAQAPAMELPDIQVSTLYYFTTDLEATREFYSDVIGLEEMETDEENLLIYDGGGVDLVFVETENELPTIEQFARQPNYDGGELDEPSFVVNVPPDRFDGIAQAIVTAGITVYNDVILVPQVGQRALVVRDPMGNTIQILAEG